MERLLYQRLKKWKESPDRKPLILEGARQVGKTWLLQQFGRKEYKNCVYINCDNNPNLQGLFEDYEIPRILRVLSAISGTTITPGETLIILDEIQELPLGLSSLKYFCENANEYHVAVAGSLLGITLHEGESFPVGKVNRMTLFPMSFTEFVEAGGNHILAEALRSRRPHDLNTMQTKLTDFLRQYYFTGGMPAVVDIYLKTGDLNKTREVQQEILNDYIGDISKHAPTNQVPRINMVWNSIPSQLAKENRKFIYSALRGGARASEFEVAIQWLCDAGLVFKVNRVRAIAEPPKFYEDMSAFKLFMNDCGLYGALSQTPPDKILVGNNVFSEYKGAFTEEFVAMQLHSIKDASVYYYSKENSQMEIDFILYDEGTLIPVEVKANENLKAKSLKTALEKSPELYGMRLSMSPYRKEERFENYPLWGFWV